MPDAPYTAHVISHTHWDREWYRTFQVFRARLVEVTDALLDLLERDPDYKYFYWDGQTSVIEDYLEMRPHNAHRLREHFASGRLYTGPWFIQPDEFLVSGESFIRNLLLGRAQCREWGTSADVGYAPDAFGHISQMPQIFRDFGIDNAVLFRGVTTDQVDSEFTWQSPDGSSVLCIKMGDNNAYSNFYYRNRATFADTDFGVPIDPDRVAADGAALLADSVGERPNTEHLLWMDGVDHIFPQPRTPQMIRILNERLSARLKVVHSTMPTFLEAVRRAKPSLKTLTGELRHSNRAWKVQALLAHVASSRIHLKQRNHHCETLLERWAEPWCTFAWRLGEPYPSELLAAAWKQLLLNQPHDSICGCSIDQVHRDMLPRYDQCEQLAEVAIGNALYSIAAKVDTTPPATLDVVAAFVVFNPLGWDRIEEVVEAMIELPDADAPFSVGIACAGKPVACDVESMPPYTRLLQAPHDIPIGEKRWRALVRFRASVPAFGHAVYHVVSSDQEVAEPSVERGDNWLANEHLRVEVAPNGCLTLVDLATGRRLSGLLLFEDGGDLGDGYNYAAPKTDEVRTTVAEDAQMVWLKPEIVRSRLRYTLAWRVPATRNHDGQSSGVEQLWIDVTLALHPGERSLRIHLDVSNHAKNHRLRVLFPTGLRDAQGCVAEQAFDAVYRSVERPDCTGWKEPQPATAPQKTWVDVSDGKNGFCLVNVGTPEYELKDDSERTLALTLLRCTGRGVGTPEDQEDGQMIGIHRFDLALVPHDGDFASAKVWQQAHAFNVPMRAVQTTSHAGTMPATQSFLRWEPESLVGTAVKRSEKGDVMIVRAVNLGSTAVAPALTGCMALGRSERVRLDEEAVDVASSDLVPSRGIVTLRLPVAG